MTKLLSMWAIPLEPGTNLPLKDCSFKRDRRLASEFRDKDHGILMHINSLVVVDIDTKNGKDGYESLKELGHSLPRTFTVSSPSGQGKHFYYTYPEAKNIHGSTKTIAPGVDIKIGSGYVASPLANPKYRIITDIEMRPCPDWLWNLLLHTEKSVYDHASQPSSEAKLAEDDIIGYLTTCQAVSQGERSNRMYYVACEVMRSGYSVDATAELLINHFNDRLDPPLPGSEVHGIVRNAQHYGKPVSTMVDMDPIEDEATNEDLWLEIFGALPHEIRPEHPVNVQIADLLSTQAGERSWLIDRWLPSSEISVIYGDGGTGKSLLAVQLAYALATRTPWLGLEPERQRPVIYLACEDSVDELRRRFTSVCNGYDKLSMPIHVLPWRGTNTYLCRFNRNGTIQETKAYQHLRKEITDLHNYYRKKMADYDGLVIILDTLANLFSGNELEREQVQTFINQIIAGLCKTKKRATDFTHSVVMLAHTNKSGQYSGSTAWNNAVSSRLALARKTIKTGKSKSDTPEIVRADNGSAVLELLVEKSNYGPDGSYCNIYYDEGKFRVANPEAQEQQHKEALLAEIGKRYTAKNNYVWPFKRTETFPDGLERVDAERIAYDLIEAGEVSVVVTGKNKYLAIDKN